MASTEEPAIAKPGSPVITYFWASLIPLALFYLPITSNYFVKYFPDPGYPSPRHNWWEKVFAAITSENYSYGAGNVDEYFINVFSYKVDTHVPLRLHATCGGITFFLMTMQFTTPIRRNFINFHRWTGRIAIPMQCILLFGSGYHLWIQDFPDHYSGISFSVTLVVLWMFSFVAMCGSMLHIIVPSQKDVWRHKHWASLNFATIFAAPGLRIYWVVYYWVGGSGGQNGSNLWSAYMTYATALWPCVAYAILANAMHDYDVPRASKPWTWVTGAAEAFGYLGSWPLACEVLKLSTFNDVLRPAATQLDTAQQVHGVLLLATYLASVRTCGMLARSAMAEDCESDAHRLRRRLALIASLCFTACAAPFGVLSLAADYTNWVYPAVFVLMPASVFVSLLLETQVTEQAAKAFLPLVAAVHLAGFPFMYFFASALMALWPALWSGTDALQAAASVCHFPLALALIVHIYMPHIKSAKGIAYELLSGEERATV